MDKEIIKPFLKYTISMFQDMYNFTPIYKNAYIVKDQKEHGWDISGVIGILGDYEGVFAIRLKRTVAFKLLNHANMAADNSKDMSQLINGMVAEFTNIICGNAMNLISKEDTNITVPFTVQGSMHTISWPAKGDIIAIPFKTPYGPFEIHINISS